MKLTRLQQLAPRIYPGHGRATTGEFLAMYSKLPRDLRKTAMQGYVTQNSLAQYSVRVVVEALFLPQITFDLAPGTPPYKAVNDTVRAPSSFGKRARSLSYFINGGVGKIENPIKRTNVFIQFLESMSEIDAELLVLIKDKDAANVGLDLNEMPEMFPEWLPGVTAEAQTPAPKEPQAQSASVTAEAQGEEQEAPKEKKKPGPKPKKTITETISDILPNG